MFIRLDRVPACDRQTDRQTELPWLIQRFALQAMRTRCKNYYNWPFLVQGFVENVVTCFCDTVYIDVSPVKISSHVSVVRYVKRSCKNDKIAKSTKDAQCSARLETKRLIEAMFVKFALPGTNRYRRLNHLSKFLDETVKG